MEDKEKKPGAFMAIGLGSGMAIGVGIGATMGNLALGIGLGAALGAALGAMLTMRNQGKDGSQASTRAKNDLSPNAAEELKAWQEAQKKPRK